jgi:glycosyltransferase involved in cell wall biosynthesis
MSNLRILIVAEHASVRFGGEAALPFHYFRVLRARGIETWMLCHERIRPELLDAFPTDHDRLLFVKDSPLQEALWKLTQGKSRFAMAACEAASHMLTQSAQRAMVKKLVREMKIDVVHEPTPVSPVQPSAMFDVGAPVVFGPMNGGLDYPDAFSHYDGSLQRAGFRAAQLVASAVNMAVPGKRKAALLLVANERTRRALPASIAHVPTIELVENGVDMTRFDSSIPPRPASSRTRFAFVGRLIDWKGVDMLLEALAKCAERSDVGLDVYGDGAVRPSLQELADRLQLGDRVTFHGFVAQDQLPKHLATNDALILPSLRECGGAVVLEAMALGKPVIATKWGGPVDYIDASCGILIEPRNRDYMIEELIEAMSRLADSPELRERLGNRGLAKVREGYDWERKVDRMLELYTQAANGHAHS